MEKNTNCVYKTNYILAECIIKFLDFLLEIDISEKKTKKQPHFFFGKIITFWLSIDTFSAILF